MKKINIFGGYVGLDGNVYPVEQDLPVICGKDNCQNVVHVPVAIDKKPICESCFVRAKREKQISNLDLIANGRRFRYLIPASSLSRIPLGSEVYGRRK